MKAKVQQILESHSVNKTRMREQVLEVFLAHERALSSKQIEAELSKTLEHTDRVTLYRTLKTFVQKGIIHEALDGTEKSKYALCHSDCNEHLHTDDHAHFNCTHCGKTICLDELSIPELNSPQGYQIQSAHLILKGSCADCSDK